MLKIYGPYTGTPAAPEASPPDLQDYVQRIDRYTYGLGWLLCEIDYQTAGFCHLSEDPGDPENLFSVEFRLYVKQGLLRRGGGHRPVEPDAGHDGDGQPPAGAGAGPSRKPGGPGLFSRPWASFPWRGSPPPSRRSAGLVYHLKPWGPGGPQAHQALPGGGGRLRGCPGARRHPGKHPGDVGLHRIPQGTAVAGRPGRLFFCPWWYGKTGPRGCWRKSPSPPAPRRGTPRRPPRAGRRFRPAKAGAGGFPVRQGRPLENILTKLGTGIVKGTGL